MTTDQFLLFDSSPLPSALLSSEGRILGTSKSWQATHMVDRLQCGWELKVIRCASQGTAELIDSETGVVFRVAQVNSEVEERIYWVSLVDVGDFLYQAKASELEQIHLNKLEDLSEMAAALAHEINNPLSVIVAKAKILSSKILAGSELSSEAISADLFKIHHQAQRIFKIVKGVRAFSRDSRNDPMALTPLQTLIEEAMVLVNSRINERGVDLKIKGVSEEVMVMCRPSQVIQVLLNLLRNALDAIENVAFPAIGIEVEVQRDNYQIYISDNGPGISPNQELKIFAPFYTTKPPGVGTGIGLSVSLRIMKEHGGGLRLERERGSSCFAIRIPKPEARAVRTTSA